MKMDMTLLNMAMRSEARSLGLCDQWFEGWADNSSIDELLDKYVKGIDFCISKGYPDNGVLKKYGGDALERHGIFVDEAIGSKQDNSPTLILNGSCSGSVAFSDMSVASLYIRHDCDITVNVSGMAQVFIELYDEAKLKIVNTSERKCFVYRHGGTVETRGNVLVRDRTSGTQNAIL